jgi:hypothetical protein
MSDIICRLSLAGSRSKVTVGNKQQQLPKLELQQRQPTNREARTGAPRDIDTRTPHSPRRSTHLMFDPRTPLITPHDGPHVSHSFRETKKYIRHGGVVATKVRTLGSNRLTCTGCRWAQNLLKSVTCSRLASTLLKYVGSAQRRPPPPRCSLRGRTKVAKVGPLRARVKSAKVRPTPYVYYPPVVFEQNNSKPTRLIWTLDLLRKTKGGLQIAYHHTMRAMIFYCVLVQAPRLNT